MSKGVKKRKKRGIETAEESSQESGVDSEIDSQSEDELADEPEVDESVTVDLGDADLDEDDPEGIEDVEKDALIAGGDEYSAARTVAIRRALEERN